jgi:hypothetical protein
VATSSDSSTDSRIDELRRENAELRRELDHLRSSRSFRLGHAVMRAATAVLPRRRSTGGAGKGRPGGPGSPASGGSGVSRVPATAEAARSGSSAPHAPAVPDEGPPSGAAAADRPAAGRRPGAAGPREGSSARVSPLDEVPPLTPDRVGPRTPDDLLVDASEVPSELLGEVVVTWRDRLPAHARLLVVHPDAPRLAGIDEVGDGVAGARVVDVGGDLDLAAAKARFGPPRVVAATPDGSLPELRGPRPRSPMVSSAFGETLPTGGLPRGPVFVGGTGRSGTWVIGRMLRHHPHWSMVHTELRFHSVPGGFVSVLDGTVTPERYAEKVEQKWFRISGGTGNAKGLQLLAARFETQQALARFVDRAETDIPWALGELLTELIEPFARGRRAVGWTETTPYNAHAAHALLTALPEARLVHTVRDGRDVASSVTSMAWGPDTIEEALDWWAGRVLQASQGVAAADPRRVLTVRLEELVHLQREASYTRLLEFLGFEDHEDVRRYFDEQVDSRRGNVGRWRKQVEKSERDRIDGRYRELLDELAERGMTVLPTEAERVDELAER